MAKLVDIDGLGRYNTKLNEKFDAKLKDITDKIPSQASKENPLADREFVNSSIATNTATFRGTYNSIEELNAVEGMDNNDYAFVVSTDSAGNTLYGRYKYDSNSWVFEYNLNNSSFTSEQWSTINSGLTSSSLSKINENISTLESNKADKSQLFSKSYNDLSDLPTIGSGYYEGSQGFQIENSKGTTKGIYFDKEDFESSASGPSPNDYRTISLKDGLKTSIDFAESERQKSKNLFDINKLILASGDNKGVVDYSNGTITLYKYYNQLANTLKEIADLEVGKTYVLSLESTGDVKQIYLSNTAVLWHSGTPLTITQEMLNDKVAIYGDSSIGNATLSKIQIEEGTVATDYQPYYGVIVHKNDAPVVFAESERQKSKNLFYAPSRTNTISGLTYTVNDTNQTITINGTSTEPNEARIAPIVPFVCKAGKTYTFSVNFISGSSLYGEVRLYLYNEATGLYTYNFGLAFRNNLTKVTKTFTEDTTFNAIRRYTTQNDVFENFVIKIQVEENPTQSEWQPYNGPIMHEKDAPVAFAESERQKSKNLFIVNGSLETNVGLTITGDSGNQKYTINGTTTSALGFWLLYNPIKLEANKSYTFSIKTSGNATFNGYAVLYFYGKSGLAGTLSLTHPSETFIFTPTADFETYNYILFDCASNNVFSNFELQVQVEEGITATDWQYPYGTIVHEKEILKDFYSGTTNVQFNEFTITDNSNLLAEYSFNNVINRNISKSSAGLSISKNGYYFVSFDCEIVRTDSSYSNLYLYLKVNGAIKLIRRYNNFRTEGKAELSASGILSLNSGDVISLTTARDNSGVTGTIDNLNFTIKEV